MTTRSSIEAFHVDAQTHTVLDVAMPIILGMAVGLGTGALIWVMVVMRFGLMG